MSFDGAYSLYSEYLASKVNFQAFVSMHSNNGVLDEMLSKKTQSSFSKNRENLEKFYGISWQFSFEGDLVYNNLIIKHQPMKNMSAATQWEARLDTLIAFKPAIVKNHNSGAKEIFIQDLKNNVYLINSSGRILWKKEIDNAILGEIHQVDYYKNGKLQYLFNTKNRLHPIDRNGNYVERYPIKFQDETELPLALFDYDKRKNYRIFVCAANQKVHVFNIQGKTVQGFKFTKADNKIIAPVQHVRNNNKDYIIVTDESRTYILNRRGETRVKMKKQFNPSPNNLYNFQRGNSHRKGRLVRTDVDGLLYFVYFDGTVETKDIDDFASNHYFDVLDVTGDNVYDFVYIDANKLSVFDLSGKKEFTYKFDNEIKMSPSFYKFSANRNYIGVTDAKGQQIYLIDGSGNILEGFPLRGKTKFSIGFLEKGATTFNLIVGGDEQYLYNYKLN